MVRCINTNGAYGEATEIGYYTKIATAFLKLRGHVSMVNHFSTIGLYGGPAHYDVSIRLAAIEAFITSSFKIFLTQTFPRCGATCYILPSRAMSQLFNGVNCVSLSGTFCRYICEF